jgi:hypothetical protein
MMTDREIYAQGERSLAHCYFVHHELQSAPETPHGFRNLKTSLPATRRFHTDSHYAEWLFEFSMDMEMYISVLIHFSTLP